MKLLSFIKNRFKKPRYDSLSSLKDYHDMAMSTIKLLQDRIEILEAQKVLNDESFVILTNEKMDLIAEVNRLKELKNETNS